MEVQRRKGEVRVLALRGTSRARRACSNARLAAKLFVRSQGLFRPRPSQKGQQSEHFTDRGCLQDAPKSGPHCHPGRAGRFGNRAPTLGQARAAGERVARMLSKGPWAGARAPIPLGRAELQREAGC